MQAIKQITKVPKNHELCIKIPAHIPEEDVIEVILLIKSNWENKIAKMKDAVKDPLFLQDMHETLKDFEALDTTGWE